MFFMENILVLHAENSIHVLRKLPVKQRRTPTDEHI